MTGRIDSHHHVWDLGVRDLPWLDGPAMAPIRRNFAVDELAPLAASAGVSTTIVIQTVPVAAETPEMLALAAENPLVGAVTGWVDLTAATVADDLARLVALPGGEYLRAIRHEVQDEPDDWLTRADVARGLAAAADAGLVYELLTFPPQLPAAIQAVGALPEGIFVLDHLSKPPIASGALEPWAARLRALAHHDNVLCKLSGLVTEADWATWTLSDLRPFFDVALDSFGPQRLMFGSDWPVCLVAASYDEVVGAAEALISELSESERDAIFGGTARRVYGIGR